MTTRCIFPDAQEVVHFLCPSQHTRGPPLGGRVSFSRQFCRAVAVGYAGNNLKAGFSAIGSQFVPVSGDKLDLYDLIPVGYGDDYKGGSISVQQLDEDGITVVGSEYYWYDDEDGQLWWDGDDEEVYPGDVTFDPGTAFWITGNKVTESIRSAGQVPTGGIDVTLRAGFTLISNPTPVAIPFNDDNDDGNFILPSGYGEDYKGGSINVQKLDENGLTVAGSEFYWYDDDDGLLWWDGDDEEVHGEVLNPGEALWVVGNSTDEKITFPGVTLK